ncbi:peptidylprolyl isomerase [Cupriavidus alkaliphilus]|uniref:peptidylprolyl isomerase n=1 Tax=Cupriavidus alkaliphilus TaxID=942866 RepID=UPI000DC24892|nr:peptidylprolyl isomerase [Cupriavidus alkaliphilus]RAS05031.1 parvulin-like peptidyl-prolyl cis-trans isomerase protein [Cupriavidus alkaliphilus]
MQFDIVHLIAATALALGLHLAQAASVNGVAITDAQITQMLQQSGLPDTPQARNAIQQQLIARELFRQEAAKDKGLESRPDVQQALRDAKAYVLMLAWLKDHIKPAPVTDAQVRERYDTIVASLGEKEYKARLIEVADPAAANSALTRIKGGEDFAKVAQAVSIAPSKARGGAMDWVSFKLPVQEGQTQNLPLPIAQAIASLPAGAVSAEPVAWNNRSFLVKVDEARPTQVPAYDTVKPGIQQALQAQALERATAALVTQLLAKAKITQ